MIRKSIREFDFNNHVQAGAQLAHLQQEYRNILKTLCASAQIRNLGIRLDSWFGRLIGALDSQLLKDFPQEYRRAIYYPNENSEPAVAHSKERAFLLPR
jgi:hypothetical protein